VGARKLQSGGFDLALIDGTLPGLSGMHLAQIAAHENTPALLMSGHPAVNDDLERFGFPYLVKPFTLSQLLEEVRQTIANADENIRRVKQSATQMQASMEQLKQTPADTKTVLDRINPANRAP
jgi:DNA-binding NtrC family response regulator